MMRTRRAIARAHFPVRRERCDLRGRDPCRSSPRSRPAAAQPTSCPLEISFQTPALMAIYSPGNGHVIYIQSPAPSDQGPLCDGGLRFFPVLTAGSLKLVHRRIGSAEKISAAPCWAIGASMTSLPAWNLYG